jgi:hypothetical protein
VCLVRQPNSRVTVNFSPVPGDVRAVQDQLCIAIRPKQCLAQPVHWRQPCYDALVLDRDGYQRLSKLYRKSKNYMRCDNV